MKIDYEKLVAQALEARKVAYTPYSHFQVGAALLTRAGRVYCGCNIENAAYTPTNCAERTAFFKAVSEGEREFAAIAIVGGLEPTMPRRQCLSGKTSTELNLCPPCGVCRQVMMEFCDPEEFQVILGTSPENYEVHLLKELLPMGFGPKNLD